MSKSLSRLSTASFRRVGSRRRTNGDGPRPLPEYHVWDTEGEQNVDGEAQERGEGVEGEGERGVDAEEEADGEEETDRDREADGETKADREKRDSSVNRVDSRASKAQHSSKSNDPDAKEDRTASQQEEGAPGSQQSRALAEPEKEPAAPRASSPSQGIRWPRTLDEPETKTASPRALTPALGMHQPCSSTRAENNKVPPSCLPPQQAPPLSKRKASPTPSGSSIQLDRNRSRRLQRVERPGNIPVHCVVTDRPKFSRDRGVLNYIRELFQWQKAQFYQKINVSGHKNHQDPSPALGGKKIKLLRKSTTPPGEESAAQPRSGYRRLKKSWRTRSAEKT